VEEYEKRHSKSASTFWLQKPYMMADPAKRTAGAMLESHMAFCQG